MVIYSALKKINHEICRTIGRSQKYNINQVTESQKNKIIMFFIISES